MGDRPYSYPASLAKEVLTALFTGAALALQIYAGGARFNARSRSS